MDIEKECCRCKKVKVAEMFGKHKRYSLGLDQYCKFCKSEMRRLLRDSGNRVLKPANAERMGRYFSRFA